MSTIILAKKMALHMLILKKRKKSSKSQINHFVSFLSEPLKTHTKDELRCMKKMNLKELNSEFYKLQKKIYL